MNRIGVLCFAGLLSFGSASVRGAEAAELWVLVRRRVEHVETGGDKDGRRDGAVLWWREDTRE